MDNFQLDNIQNFHPSSSEEKKHYLVLQNVNRIPPHIGLVVNNHYYSTAVSGIKTKMNLETVLKNIQQKNIECLFIELENITVEDESVIGVFENYGLLDKPEKSCLFPVISVLKKAFQYDFRSEFVFDLIPELQQQNLIKSYHSLHLSTVFPHSFRLNRYSRTEINFCIDQLNQKIKV